MRRPSRFHELASHVRVASPAGSLAAFGSLCCGESFIRNASRDGRGNWFTSKGDGALNFEGCPLCRSEANADEAFCVDEHRSYLRCSDCALVFVRKHELPTLAEERAHYQHHQNAVDDPGYRRFLSRALDPLLTRVPARASGLDFGCGPGPALAAMLSERGHVVALYDSAFYPDKTPLARAYDFVTCTEVIEHVHDARTIWQTLHDLLHDGGWLVVMTKRVRDREAFRNWHYKRDPTHVRFYSEQTFEWIARNWNFELSFEAQDVVLLQRC